LVPDLSMSAYVFGKRVGAATYNLVHLEAVPLVIGAIGVIQGSRLWFRLH
jgi:hypothetical protein